MDQTATLTLTVFSSAANASTVSLPLPGGIASPNYFSVPFGTFSGSANFANLGAIRLTVTAANAATLALDFLRTTATNVTPAVEATLTDVVLVDNDGNGQASAGDRLRYVMRLRNNSGTDLTNVQANVPALANTTLAAGSLTVTPLARDDGPSGASAPGDPFHGYVNQAFSLTAAQGLLTNDLTGTPGGSVTYFGGGSLGGSVTDHATGSTAAVAEGSLAVNADGSLTFTPTSTFNGIFVFQYRLANALGSDDATVRVAIGHRPAAVADARNVTGNVKINTALTPAFSVLANDAGDHGAISSFQNPSAQGGAVNLSANGQFTYDPPAGFTGADTFTYTMTNGFGSSPGTVTLTVSGRVWFINNAAAAGSGRLRSPFNSVAAFVAMNDGGANHPGAGDSVFIYTGSSSYAATTAAGLSLLHYQKVIGQGANVAESRNRCGDHFRARQRRPSRAEWSRSDPG